MLRAGPGAARVATHLSCPNQGPRDALRSHRRRRRELAGAPRVHAERSIVSVPKILQNVGKIIVKDHEELLNILTISNISEKFQSVRINLDLRSVIWNGLC